AEAMAMGLPVIVERNAWTLPQERYNTVWVREKEVGLVLHSFSQIAEATAQLLEPETFVRFRTHARSIQNRALFEIPMIFQSILERGTEKGTATAAALAANIPERVTLER